MNYITLHVRLKNLYNTSEQANQHGVSCESIVFVKHYSRLGRTSAHIHAKKMVAAI